MNRCWLAWLCVLVLPLLALAQNTKKEAAPDQGQKEVTASTAANSAPASATTPKPPDYSQEPFVVENFRTEVRFENDGTGTREQTARIRVQSDAGVQQLGELVFGYSSANETMEVKFVRVRKPDGKVVTAEPSAVKEMTAAVERDAPTYTDYKEKHITVPGLQSGDTLEYDILTRLMTPLAPHEFWYTQNFLKNAIVLHEQLDVNIPADRALIVKSAEFSRIDGKEQHATELQLPPKSGPLKITGDFSQETSGDRTIFHWKHANLSRPADDQEENKTPKPESLPADVQITTFKNWAEVAGWYAGLEKGRSEPDAAIRAKVAQLIQGKTTDLGKMEALYDYVSTSIRYVSLSFGLGRYQPHTAAEVFSNQYGDCKDKQTLLASMLDVAGIRADAALIPYERKLDLSVPSPSQFDHIITAVPEGDRLIWMDSTAEVAPFRMLTAPLRNKSALLVPPDGAGKIVTTPEDPPFLSTQRVLVDAQVSDLGKLTAKVQYFLRGDNEFALRAAFRRTPQTQWKDLGQTLAAMDGIRGQVTSVKPSDPANTRDPFEIDLEYTQPNFLDWSTKEAKVDLPLLTIGLPQIGDENTDEIKLGSPLDVTLQLKLKLPDNFTAQAPVGIAVARDYAEFKSSYEFSNHTLDVERTLDFKSRSLPASRTSDYLAFERAVESDEGQPLVVENSVTGAPSIPASAKPAELLEAGAAALNSGNPRAAVPLFKRVVELEPNHKQAWNDLGLSYLRLGQFDDAAGAFQKQIGVNPYDEHAYDYLGIALEQQQKFGPAADAFHKQLGVNPLDPLAHTALGTLYLEQHQYAAAVPELEKAVILAPDNAGLQVSLGRAYLNTGEKDKALAAFNKGAEMSKTPLIWNDVAFALADQQLDLPKALQYAQSAASATSASLRNADLAHLTLDDLSNVQSLGAIWDTLGWVYFRQGDLDRAEHYIRSAWLLNEHGEVGDHLAQIYEKRGVKDLAAQTFALAAASDHSIPETRGRLATLLGVDSKDPSIDERILQARPGLVALRTLAAGDSGDVDGSADFLLLLSPEGKSAKVDDVEFVSGSGKLRPLMDRLRALDFGAVFPDESPAKLVRRGTLSCSTGNGKCVFVLALPEDLRTVN